MVENAFGISVSRFWVPLVTMAQRPRIVRDIVYTMCGVAQQDEDSSGPGQTGHQTKEMMEWPYRITRWRVCPMRTTGILQGRSNINKNY